MRVSPLLPFAVAAGLAAASAPAQDGRPVAQDGRPVLIEAARVLLAPGELAEGPDARLLIRDGRVAGVGRSIPADSAARATRIRFAGATVVPGMVLVHDLLGAPADLAETIEPFTPDLRAADAFDPYDDELRDRARTGVTSVVLAPSSANTFGGIACVVKRHADQGVLASAESYLKLALVAESLSDDRYPTSRMGAADLIRTSFAAATSPLRLRSPALDALRSVVEGERRIAIHARTHAEITSALDVCAELGLEPMLLDCQEIEDTTLERLRGSGASIALAPLGYESTEEQLAVPARLAAAGVAFSFLGRDGHELRVSTALAVAHGVDRRTAHAVLTRVPAEQAGLGDRVGSLRVGRDADFLVLTGDPVDLSSRLLQVWVDGQLVHDATADLEAGVTEASR